MPNPLLQSPGQKPKTATNLRRTYIGYPRQAVAAGASADIKCDVLEPFKLEQQYLAPAAQALDVSNIRVGTKPLNVSPNPISGNVFSEQAVGNVMSGYTAQPGTGIVVSVQNNTGASVNFGGGAMGWAAV